MNEFRPICLICCIYKDCGKFVGFEIKMCIGKIISKCYSAFVLGRQILDGVLTLNEIVDFAKRSK